MTRPLLLKVDYGVTAASAQPERTPLNIALVLDRSGSMAEMRKLPFTLEAAREVIQNMSERDVLSIVAFNNKAVVLSPAGRVVNKVFLLHRLDEVTPGGYTDISAGLLEGVAQIDSQRADGQVQHVLLLTDGIANRGVTTAEALSKLAAKAHARGIGVSTFGCGTEFNEKRLAEMANAGGGRYTYVKEPEQIPTAFVEELHGLAPGRRPKHDDRGEYQRRADHQNLRPTDRGAARLLQVRHRQSASR
jgi:Ca-activated chloride channel family protein